MCLLLCGYCYVAIAMWLLLRGYMFVDMCLLLCGYCYVAIAMWLLLCGYCYVAIAIWLLQGFRLAGAENGEDCYCGGNEGDAESMYRLGRAFNCNKPCKNATEQVCGGEWSLSVLRTIAGKAIKSQSRSYLPEE
jgi:hypothetical protein